MHSLLPWQRFLCAARPADQADARSRHRPALLCPCCIQAAVARLLGSVLALAAPGSRVAFDFLQQEVGATCHVHVQHMQLR